MSVSVCLLVPYDFPLSIKVILAIIVALRISTIRATIVREDPDVLQSFPSWSVSFATTRGMKSVCDGSSLRAEPPATWRNLLFNPLISQVQNGKGLLLLYYINYYSPHRFNRIVRYLTVHRTEGPEPNQQGQTSSKQVKNWTTINFTNKAPIKIIISTIWIIVIPNIMEKKW